MLERLEGYTDPELDDIADENETWDPAGAGSTLDEASEGMRLFIADFEQCTTEGAAGAATGTSEPSSSEPAGSTEPTATTEPAGSSETTEG